MAFIGKEVAVNRGKPDSFFGKLVGVQQDYLIVHTKDQSLIYCPAHCVQSFSEIRRKKPLAGYNREIRMPVAYSFLQLLSLMHKRTLTIGHEGSELAKGVVTGLSVEELLLQSEGKLRRISLERIRFIKVSIS